MSRQKKLKFQLTSAIFILVCLLISGFFVLGPDLMNVVHAVTGNYGKADGDSLTIDDWNGLTGDFLDKQSTAGDSMAGTLRVPNLVIESGGTCIGCGGSSITDSGGTSLFMVCDRSSPSSWQSYNDSILYTDITIPTSAGFTATPQYFTSISGNTQHYRLTGTNSIFIRSQNVFRIYVVFDGTITPTQAETYNWAVDWCAIGN